MNDYEFTYNILGECDEIYIDSSSLLYEYADRFFENYHTFLLSQGKKIVILIEVREEIARHISNPEKQPLAYHALELLQKYKDIIEIEGGVSSEEDADKAFADVDFISYLTQRRRYVTSLLITNDSDLAADINSLNQFKSYNGKPVYSCLIDSKGELKHNATKSNEHINTEPVSAEPISTEKTIPKKKWRIVFHSDYSKNEKADNNILSKFKDWFPNTLKMKNSAKR